MNELDVRVRAEIEAITKIAEALSPLTSESIQNVLAVLNRLYQVKGTAQATAEKPAVSEGQETQPTFSAFHELFDAALPETGPEKALVAAYWLQEIQENKDLDSFLINKELKSIDEPSTNITRDLDALVKRIPRWVHQARKEGTPRKSYTVTTEGIRAVQRMLANNRTSTRVESDSDF